jgi:hypothetical protein
VSELSQSKSGLRARVVAANEKLPDHEVSQLETPTAAILHKLDLFVLELEGFKGLVDGATKDSILDMQTKVMEILSRHMEVKSSCEEQIAAIEFLESERKRMIRKKQMASRYQLTKVQE